MSVDRLSSLPDEIICHILSFLEMKQASITCLLSRRWQFLWIRLPGLRFKQGRSWNAEEMRKFVTRVHRTLVICRRDNLEIFEVNFNREYDECFADDVNVWIRYAVENKVKIFSLLIPGCHDHLLPEMMYTNLSWTSLTIRGCFMAPLRTIQWQSLTALQIDEVGLENSAFKKIFSGCPVLSSLDMAFCWGFNLLEVNSPSLRTLSVKGDDRGNLKISAPHIHTFIINWLSIFRKFSLENIKSLVRAEIDMHGEWKLGDIIIGRRSVEQLFGSIGHVMMLKLNRQCTLLLSLTAQDWQLPQSTRRCLELHAFYGTICIRGIVGLLESSPNLESLVIDIDGRAAEGLDSLNPGSKDDLDCDLPHLKIVSFKQSVSSIDYLEPMSTLARILLKRAIALEKMVVSFPRFTASSSTTAFYETTQTLLSYPRSSQKAVVELVEVDDYTIWC